MTGLHPLVLEIARAVSAAGGRAFLVGGWVREYQSLRQQGSETLPSGEEFDFEVYHLPPERLVAVLERFGQVNLVGESFAVYKLSPRGEHGSPPPVIDVSLDHLKCRENENERTPDETQDQPSRVRGQRRQQGNPNPNHS